MSAKKVKKINKGAPSGFVVSLIFHGAIFFIAGLFVVFKVVTKPDYVIEAPVPIERPRMQLKKPKVKVNKNSKPKPSSRIVAKVKTKQMPEIQIPDLEGVGEGLLAGTGEGSGIFMDIPEVKMLSMMGSTESTGTDLIGTYYDLKRRSNGGSQAMSQDDYFREMYRFMVDEKWNPRAMAKYYSLPTKLYLTTLIVPVITSNFAPVAFGDVDATEGSYWMVHYTGKISHRDGITFRFWAAGDNHLVVALDKEIVVASQWAGRGTTGRLNDLMGAAWSSQGSEDRVYICGRDALTAVGSWITLEPGEQRDIDICLGDQGGLACAYLLVEVKGEKYERSTQGGPILPAFKTAEISDDLIDVIYPSLPKDEMVTLTSGPVFNDLAPVKRSTETAGSEPEKEDSKAVGQDRMRTWTLNDGQTYEAELSNRTTFDGSVVLVDADGEELIRVQMAQLSPQDQEFLDIVRVPKLELDSLEKLPQVLFSSKTAEQADAVRDPEIRARFGVRVKQASSAMYNHELTAEIFGVGRQIYADRYMVLSRETVPFRLTKENGKRFEYVSERWVPIRDAPLRDWQGNTIGLRGEKVHGYLLIVRDKLGNIVAHEEYPDWLYDNLENMLKLQPGNYFDKHCIRRPPIRPEPVRDLNF